MTLISEPETPQPESPEKYNDSGNILAQQGKLEAAAKAYQQAINLQPDFAIAHNNLGNILVKQGKLNQAISVYQHAIALEPSLAIAHNNLGNIFAHQGKMSEAIAAYETALSYQPQYPSAKLGRTIAQLAMIYRHESEIVSSRDRYRLHLEQLAAGYQDAELQEQQLAANTVGSNLPFALAYQGLNDIELQRTFGAMNHQLMASSYPQWCQPLAIPQLKATDKIRVGVVSGFFHHHSVWKMPVKGWVENIDRSEFELFAYYTGTISDRETAKAAQVFDRFEHHTLSVNQWAEKIAADKLQVLIFPEFGMNSMTVKLGCLRLAPIQITSWGHPITSGLPTIDYYLSSELMEPENAPEHYTEQLIRLPNLGIHYQPLPLKPKAISKQELGLQANEIMFWCCQSLFKYLPQHDDVFPRITQQVPSAKFVFIQLESDFATNIFRQRLADIFQQYDLEAQDYCLFLPRLKAESFAGTTAIADIFLDNIGWSGCNTAIESIAHDIPLVTMPEEMMRSRHSLAMLRMMGVEATIASSKEEYIQIAVHLAQDANYRQQVSQQIALNKHKLYGDLQPVRALEDWLLQVVNKPRRFNNPEVAQAFQLAVQYQQANNLGAAQQQYLKVLAAQPKHPETLYSLGQIAQHGGQLGKAEQYWQLAVRTQPEYIKAWFSLGNLAQSQGQYQQAELAYRQALKLRPDSVAICNNLGYVLQLQEKWSEAATYYRQAFELDPKCVAAEVNWGNALHAQGKLTPEQQLYYAQLNCKLGRSRHQVRDWQTATTYFRQAILMQPDLVDAHYHLAWALQEQRQLTEAIACYQRVGQLDPNCGAAYFNLGKIYQDLGDLNQATVNFKQGLKLINPKYAQAINSATQTPSLAENYPIPQIPLGEVTIGAYQFPVIPPVAASHVKRPFWSIVIPVVNRPEYFPECLASVLAQWTGRDMEIIVLDNGSNPPQRQIPDILGRGIIRYYRFPDTIPLQANWNTAVSLCRGQWIHLLHHDDYVLPGFYTRFKAGLENCPDSVGAAFTGYENINEERQIIFSQQYNLGNHRGVVPNWLSHLGVSCMLSPPSLVIRRQAYEQLGGYKLDLLYTCDWEFYKRVATYYDWWYEPGILAHYREQANSITIAENMNGSSGAAHRYAIEISHSYLPVEQRATITAKSLAFHFDWCVNQARIPLNAGNMEGAINLLKEALKMERSPAALSRLSRWLQQESAASLLNQLAASEATEDTEATILSNLARELLGSQQQNLRQKSA